MRIWGCGTAATFCVAVAAFDGSAVAATVGYGDRVNFLDAVGGQPVVEDNFDYDIAAAYQITFASGVISTSPETDHPSRNTVVSESGWYLNVLSNDEPNVSQVLTWEFPEEIVGFGMDYYVGGFNGLEVTFLGQLLVPDNIPGSDDNSFFGYLSDEPFQTLTFSTNFPMGSLGVTIDDLVFVPAPHAVVPLPASLPFLLSGLGGLVVFRRLFSGQN
ncbi:VPLPA-CTERM sorting domain-containing protein [uncultured Roseibium sp.]|uniref:VPLPA-CTERM sorting domain-containing protein n=1 Tax=uncultured Roseibium sp. TaxID=1936171 RepID=UPI0026234AA0|nr:VPLPA-CTERM sorting domain-containing protein [uncultured Roseibium sp.]